uniref:DUF3615 domain-containing protein n=1 Tax=Oryza brachyantha TaxID=4533 RepID=J3N260_ORYBR
MEDGMIHARASRAGPIRECQGKSKFFIEHQATWEKEGRNKGYDTNVHGWRFGHETTIPEGEFPTSRGSSKPLWSEQDKEEARRRHREGEAVQLRQRMERVRMRWRERFGAGKAPPPPRRKQLHHNAEEDSRHAKNVQMAVDAINRKHPGRNYELWEISANGTVAEIGASYCHYNFTAYSPSSGFGFFFAETSEDAKCEDQVHSWCSIETGEIGYCASCMSDWFCLVHPSRDKFIFGNESFHCSCTEGIFD